MSTAVPPSPVPSFVIPPDGPAAGLNAEIAALLGQLRPTLPPPVFAQLDGVLARLEAARVGVGAPVVGDHAPDVLFVDGAGARVPLRALTANEPLVLLFFRGGWCVFCDLTLRAYERVAEQFRAAGARLVAVSPQTAEATAATGAERALTFELLRDPDNAAAQTFGLAWSLTEGERPLYQAFGAHLDRANGNGDWALPAPAAFVIDPAGMVRYARVDADYTQRADPAEVLAAVRALGTNLDADVGASEGPPTGAAA